MNPVPDGDGQLFAWRTCVAERIEVDAAMKWTDLNEREREANPIIGTIEPAVAATLARLLRPHTATPTDCFFLVWEGYSGMRDDLRGTSSITILPTRRALILAGTDSIDNMALLRHGGTKKLFVGTYADADRGKARSGTIRRKLINIPA
ncbi:hypothetical protein [Cryobacterium sp. Y11]|uniref:hypothetical protein n=1 Tax=Cryobacterium sp. Y11 TaxID=2045016 RepID=UPI0011B0D504